MGQRLDLQAALEEVLGSSNVYFQPPSTKKMIYPAIVYERDNAVTQHADDYPYRYTQRYAVTYIDTNPDSVVINKLAAMQTSVFNRHFATAGLNHDVFTIYF